MTPELKRACELVFQEHKTSAQPIKWSPDTFRGRVSLGLAELAKETLLKKEVIVPADKSRKQSTRLNPVIVSASSLDEAQRCLEGKQAVVIPAFSEKTAVPMPPRQRVAEAMPAVLSRRVMEVASPQVLPAMEVKWCLRPVFCYLVWPLCAVVVGGLATFIVDSIFTWIFLR